MKKIWILAVMMLFNSKGAWALNTDVSPADFWVALRALAAQCAVQPYTLESDGQKTYGTMRSICPGLLVSESASGSVAMFELGGSVYVASLQDSADSDGGDLNDVTIRDSRGDVVVSQQNVLAYRDIILALVGRSFKILDVYVPSL